MRCVNHVGSPVGTEASYTSDSKSYKINKSSTPIKMISSLESLFVIILIHVCFWLGPVCFVSVGFGVCVCI